MVDHIKTLLLNPESVPEYLHVTDQVVDEVLRLFGVDGPDCTAAVDALMPLALAADLVGFRAEFDQRLSQKHSGSVYRTDYTVVPAFDELYSRILSPSGWWTVSSLFVHDDPSVNQKLAELRDAATSGDSAFALGAVLIACAYRRLLLQKEAG